MTNKRTNRGRPPLPKDVVCDYRVVTFLNERMRQRIDEISARNGSSISQTCRDLIVSAIESIDKEHNKQHDPQEGST